MKINLHCMSAIYAYLYDFLLIFQVSLEGLMSLRCKMTLLNNQEFNFLGSEGFAGDFLNYSF